MTLPPLSAAGRTSRLFRSLVILSLAAAIIIVTIVLPAEYGIDPTGIGGKLGLKQMGEIKQQLAREEASHETSDAPAAPDTNGNKQPP
jgi:hypothetical protein